MQKRNRNNPFYTQMFSRMSKGAGWRVTSQLFPASIYLEKKEAALKTTGSWGLGTDSSPRSRQSLFQQRLHTQRGRYCEGRRDLRNPLTLQPLGTEHLLEWSHWNHPTACGHSAETRRHSSHQTGPTAPVPAERTPPGTPCI